MINIPPEKFNNELPEDNLEDKKAKGESKPLHEIAVPKDSWFDKLLHSAIATAEGSNRAGRILGRVFDIASFFVPYGHKVNSVRRIIKSQIQPKQDKQMNWIVNRLKEKSTWRGVIAVVTALGVSLSPSQTAAIVALGVAVAGAFEVFFKEPLSPDKK